MPSSTTFGRVRSTFSFYWPSVLILSVLFSFAFEAPPLSSREEGVDVELHSTAHTDTTSSSNIDLTSVKAESPLVCDKRPYQLCGAGRFKHPHTTIGPHYAATVPGHHQHRVPSDSLITNKDCPRAEQAMDQAKTDRSSGSSRDITFVVLYYEEPQFLSHHIETWLSWPSDLRDRFNFLIVDDGSRAGLRAEELIAGQSDDLRNHIHLEVYYIEQNLCWNIAGARNLAAFMAKTEYIFVCDADTIMPRYQTAKYLLDLRAQSMDLYNLNGTQQIQFHFDRFIERGNLSRKPHPAVMLLSKKTYWMSGGCDEDG